MASIKTVIPEYVAARIDRNLVKNVLSYTNAFIRKDEQTINFLGGNLIGVYSFKWLEEDRLKWIEDVMNIDDIDGLENDIRNLSIWRELSGGEKVGKFFVSSDAVNLTYVWLAHKALQDRNLSEDDRERLAVACIDMLQYKFLSSIHTRFFKYAANEGLAKATYEALDLKSGLKKYGTWKALLDARTEDILFGKYRTTHKASDKGLHWDTIRDFNDDEAIVKMLNDIQGRLKAIMIKLTDTFNRLRVADARIHSTTKFTTVDGESIMKEASSQYESIRERLHMVVPSRNDFVKEELIEAITKTVTTVGKHQLEETLKFISDNYNSKIGGDLHKLVDDIIIYAFDVIRHERMNLEHIPSVMLKLRNMYRSSRVTDPLLISIRDRSGEYVSDALSTHSSSTIASTRIGVILYIVLRGLLEH